jgi:cytochrome c oxidase subunit 3
VSVPHDAHAHFQYSDAGHQAETAMSGMWLFLAQEVLFFGALIFVWSYCCYQHPAGFRLATQHANLLIGSINTAVLLTSSFTFTAGLLAIEQGETRRLIQACWSTAALGATFLILKGIEWYKDYDDGLIPGAHFSLTGPDSGGAQIFYAFYYVATVLHALHMIIGIGLVLWIAWRARRGDFSREWSTPVEVVGLYWSFVDVVWLTLYPLIYLVAR